MEVPAGKFKAVRVEQVVHFTFAFGEPYRQTDWYAPGVGLIKTVAGQSVTTLKSFTPAMD